MTAVATGYIERPDYRVDLLPRRNRIVVRDGETVLADTTASILVDEQDHGLVFYIPVSDVRQDLLTETDDHSRCPYKGEARYWRVADRSEPVAWDYPEPYAEVGRLRDHIAFYQDRLSVEVGVATPAVSAPFTRQKS